MLRYSTILILSFAASAVLSAASVPAQDASPANAGPVNGAQTAGNNANITSGQPVPEQPATPDATTTEGFRLTALMSNSFQLQASDLAAKRAQDPAVRDYAQKMIPIHERSTVALTNGSAGGSDASDAALVAAAAKGGRAPLDATFQRLLDTLTAAPAGPNFDAAFGRAQVEGHHVVIQAYETYLRVGTNEAIRKFVEASLPKMKENAAVAARLPGGETSR